MERVVISKGTHQRLIRGDARAMDAVDSSSVHLAITSPPYFNAKVYSDLENDLGNIHVLDEWLFEIGKVWTEIYRVLMPGRKFFLNIMYLPVKDSGSFRSLNLVGKSIDLCERAGFVFKREIIWHKTNGVRAHFGTYPYPGGILINNMHESVLEFEKPAPSGCRKYAHVSAEEKEAFVLDKAFWLSVKNTDVWSIKPELSGYARSHIAPFPLELPERLIRAYSYVGETVLDPFLGSGTSLMASAIWNRNGVGYELNPNYYTQAHARLSTLVI